MAVPDVIAEFAAGPQASASYESGIRQVLLYLMGDRPFVLARIAAPIDLTQGMFTSLTFDTIIAGSGDLLSGVPDPGIYAGYASARTNGIKGNKNLRAQLNGGQDPEDDSGPWAADDNNHGVQTPAKAGRVVPFADVFDTGDYMDVGMFVDTAEPAQVVNGVFFMEWRGNAGV